MTSQVTTFICIKWAIYLSPGLKKKNSIEKSFLCGDKMLDARMSCHAAFRGKDVFTSKMSEWVYSEFYAVCCHVGMTSFN